MKLKSDVLTSTNDGLLSEKKHLTLELKETRTLQKSYEKKCHELMAELNTVTTDYQNIKRQVVGHDELNKEREERIERLKTELAELKTNYEALEIERGTLKINYGKVIELQ
jgi:chromosome segregation ATPase